MDSTTFQRESKWPSYRESKWPSYIVMAVLIVSHCFTSINGERQNERNTLRGGNLEETLVRKRYIRSPFLPPLVTAQNPDERSETENQVAQARSSHSFLIHPVPNSQTMTKRKLNYKPQQIDLVKYHYSHSYNPIAAAKQKLPQVQHLRLQNDQSLTKETAKLAQENLRSKMSAGGNRKKEKSGNSKRSMQYFDLDEVLRGINKTHDELWKILMKIKVPINDFLEFIENGASKEQIFELINEDENIKSQQRRNSSDNFKINEKNIWDDFPFEEFVHQIVVRDKNNIHKNEKQFADNLKLRRIDDNYYEPNEYRAPRDSPIVTHFSATRRINNDTNQSAAIVSMSIEEPKQLRPEDKERIISKHNMLARNKITSSDNLKGGGGPIPRMYADKSEEFAATDSPPSSYNQQMRLVFPVKGILVFCGILGSIALVTVIILIIYGSVKCTKVKPISNNYQVSERIELTTAQCQ